VCVDTAGVGTSSSTAACGGARCPDASGGPARGDTNASRGTAAGRRTAACRSTCRRCTACGAWWPWRHGTAPGPVTARDHAGARDTRDLGRRTDT
jgi:hypothetical protein